MSTNLLQQPTAQYRAKLGACDGLEEIGLVCPALREWARVLDAVVVAGQDDGTPPWSLRPRWALAHTFSHFRPSHLDVCTDKAVERKHNGPDVGGIDDRDPTDRRRDHRARFGPRTADLPVSEADRNADDLTWLKLVRTVESGDACECVA